MFILGHLGIGTVLARPFLGPGRAESGNRRRSGAALPWHWMLLGAILPDLIDKPLYYGLSWVTGLHGGELGLISGTRTFGHTAILAVAWVAGSAALKSRVLAAIALGVSTHLLLDHLGDALYIRVWGDGLIESGMSFWRSDRVAGLLFPFLGWRFPDTSVNGFLDHFFLLGRVHIVAGELIGAMILYREWRRRRLTRRS